ncbi:MAG: ribosomal RNA small subunit methyltransferase A [Dehalococcoidia bacterium]|nr:ribosomal RNA small subunit methyltransferase A [Dehalococcoidia bacterium]
MSKLPKSYGPGTRAKKSLGQNFLVDGRVRTKIVEAADISPTDTILEVGPGRGFLTKALAQRAGRLVAVELDDGLIPRLQETFADSNNVEIVEGDARTVDIDCLAGTATDYKVVANLPYYAATPIVRRFLEATHKPTTLVVMVQKEVGLEMAAGPGKMGILSVATQVYGSPRIVTSIPPKAFRPSPNVTSAVVRIDTYAEPAVKFDGPEKFFTLVRAGFSAPRKQIHNSLKNGLGIESKEIMALLRNAEISATRRAQTLSIKEWGNLYREYASTL